MVGGGVGWRLVSSGGAIAGSSRSNRGLESGVFVFSGANTSTAMSMTSMAMGMMTATNTNEYPDLGGWGRGSCLLRKRQMRRAAKKAGSNKMMYQSAVFANASGGKEGGEEVGMGGGVAGVSGQGNGNRDKAGHQGNADVAAGQTVNQQQQQQQLQPTMMTSPPAEHDVAYMDGTTGMPTIEKIQFLSGIAKPDGEEGPLPGGMEDQAPSNGLTTVSLPSLPGMEGLLDVSTGTGSDGTAVIKVVGVGGAGCNVVNDMVKKGDINDENLYVMNTDLQALRESSLPRSRRILLGGGRRIGFSMRGSTQLGQKLAEASEKEIVNALEGADVVFITAGMGGGTGGPAAPVVAGIAKSMGALTGVKGITDMITMPGLVNVDFTALKELLADSGHALLGIGTAEGQDRARTAAKAAVSSPLLQKSLQDAKAVVYSVTGDSSMSLYEVTAVSEVIYNVVDDANAHVVFAANTDESMNGQVQVVVIAAGLSQVTEPSEAAIKPPGTSAPSPQKTRQRDQPQQQQNLAGKTGAALPDSDVSSQNSFRNLVVSTPQKDFGSPREGQQQQRPQLPLHHGQWRQHAQCDGSSS
ncbi:hypothetical protein CBR_g44487 [Chara braunii]|uniref:Tubulin/FtsZ GTPase domain-containing protein n=1 Tax=Chara braunii TaxID=69332 RepID=A0A388LXH9_CHABU|nr:hypothetical protein CBR_g44487 [Chara braunii]|eukprot:GBG87030.1 hypothetical protein CBR_g44487 [Chara braunii]